MARKNVPWTNKEVKTLERAHLHGNPSIKHLIAVLPRHPPSSSKAMAVKLGLRSRQHCKHSHYHYWLDIAHRHFARREAGLLA